MQFARCLLTQADALRAVSNRIGNQKLAPGCSKRPGSLLLLTTYYLSAVVRELLASKGRSSRLD